MRFSRLWLVLLLLTLTSSAFAKPAKPTKPKRAAPVVQAGPQIVHQAPPEQSILTPLPIWVETSGPAVDKVVVKYKVLGDKKWKVLPLSRMDAGWGAEVPCRDVGTVTGLLRYYVVAYDAEGNEVATSGSAAKPLKVKVRRTIKSAPLHLPGRSPPAKCSDPADCPPGFPGCSSSMGDEDACTTNDDCDEGLVCAAQKCAPPVSSVKDNWITLTGSVEFALIRDSDYCGITHQTAGDYWCARSDKERYYGSPLSDTQPTSSSGAAAGRIVLGYDRFFDGHVALGLRAGLTVWGIAPMLQGRARSLPVWGELRLSYWFLRDTVVRPFVFLAGGFAPTDYHFRVLVDEDKTMPAVQSNPDEQTLDAYRRLGPYHGGLGLGLMFALSPDVGIVLDAEGMMTFPRQGWAVTPELGMAFGF